MDKQLLIKHLQSFIKKLNHEPEKLKSDEEERNKRIVYYQSWTKARILNMDHGDLLEYLSKLWAMLIWGNKQYVVDKLIEDNGFEKFKEELANLIWSEEDIESRWNRATKNIKGFGPAMQSELLCHVFPDKYILWNRRAYVGLDYLGVKGLPKYNYQLNGKKYKELSQIGKDIALEMKALGAKDFTLLAVDYFLWEDLQFEANLSQIHKENKETEPIEKLSKEESHFVHNEIRDKIRDIGDWLGFSSKIEQKVADGSRVDVFWESTIGNMGRVLYVFEVQTKGSIDSLILNLLKSKNNAAVQGIVAVSDKTQIEKIKKHSANVRDLENIKFWDYEEVIQVHESLEFVNTSINKLKLVPDSF